MYIHVDAMAVPATVQLVEPDDFQRFAVVVSGPPNRLPDVAAALAPLGTVDAGGGHAYLRPDAVRGLTDADDTWDAGFARMIDYARDHGWVDAAGRVRAHVEWPG
ncbi:MAG TPA: hypothetical protein VHV74_23800 [Pseudonocardiaceae bacterium]|jgi:hypothetical protein|nr:hypothetical protein [Pseudonocardiaceae bacterium]